MKAIVYIITFYLTAILLFHMTTCTDHQCGEPVSLTPKEEVPLNVSEPILQYLVGEVTFVLHLPLLKIYWLTDQNGYEYPVRVPLEKSLPSKGAVAVCTFYRELVNIDQRLLLYVYVELDRTESSMASPGELTLTGL